MRILLDTHIALWAIADTAKLSAEHAFFLKTLVRPEDAPKYTMEEYKQMIKAYYQ